MDQNTDIHIERLVARTLREATTLPTTDGETVKQFMRALQDAAKAAIRATYGESVSVYTEDSDGVSATFNVYRYSGESSLDTYLKLDYTREDSTGTFTFSNPVEMQRITSFAEAPTGQRQLGVTTIAVKIESLVASNSPTGLDVAKAAADLSDSKIQDRASLKEKLESAAARVPVSDPYKADIASILRTI